MDVRKTVEELLGRMGENNHQRTAELFAESVDFMCAGRAPWIKARESREDMADFFAEMDSAFDPEGRSASISGLFVDGRDVIVTGRVGQRLRSNAESFEIPFALHLTVSEDGEISRYHVYEDSLTIVEALAEGNIG